MASVTYPETYHPIYARALVALIPEDERPWYAACRIVKEVWKHRPIPLFARTMYPNPYLPRTQEANIYRESLQRLALDIEIGRAELVYERSFWS